jgi:hypothetical protein
MTRERLIWRPNAVPLDVWEAMSREEKGSSSFFGPFFAAKHLGPDNPWKIA